MPRDPAPLTKREFEILERIAQGDEEVRAGKGRVLEEVLAAASQMLDLEVLPLSPADAELIARWRYAGRYAFYEPASVDYMLDPRNGFLGVRDPSGLIGFCSFGSDARVAGGSYDDEALDVGAGMDPRLVGSGHGQAFLNAIVAYATLKLNAARLRVTIASWNERALRAARGVGFRSIATFKTEHGVAFTVLVRDAIS